MEKMEALLAQYRSDLPQINDLNDVIMELRKEFQNDTVNLEYIEFLLRSYKSNKRDWDRYAIFDGQKYTRNLVDTGNGKYNLMLLCWNKGQGSPIHDHADSSCFMKMLEGGLVEIRFNWPKNNEELQETGRNVLEMDDVCYMHDKLGLHRVENISKTEKAISLHLYCPPYDTCSIFNQENGQRTMGKVTFWSVYGKIEKVSQTQICNNNPLFAAPGCRNT